jgi:hypothetical protein
MIEAQKIDITGVRLAGLIQYVFANTLQQPSCGRDCTFRNRLHAGRGAFCQAVSRIVAPRCLVWVNGQGKEETPMKL